LPLVAINVVRYNQDYPSIQKCIRAALDQDFDDCTVTLTENGSTDSIKGQILAEFGSHPKFCYVDNGTNLGFSGAHNRFFFLADARFVMPLNPDTELARDYLRHLIGAFENPAVAAAEGKMLKPTLCQPGPRILDGTGMVISRARKARERGHLEVDHGQYDDKTDVFGVSGTAAIYRKSALEQIKHSTHEYFDQDFFTYWEDLDISWRLQLAGFKCSFVPGAVVYHSRFAGQSRHGFRRPLEFLRHTRTIPTRILCWDWRNHLFAIIKNEFGWSFWRDVPFIFTRETLLFAYLTVCEPRVLRGIPTFLRLLPRILKKRRMVQRTRQVTSAEMSRWFGRLT
jgi:GT2 family glycosyltransferase